MSDAIRVFVRYDIADDKGETRRERNAKFGHDAPPLEIPEAGQFLWGAYFELSSRLVRVRDGVAFPVTWADIHGWLTITERNFRGEEIQILLTMDDAFCEAMNAELKAKHAAEKDKGKGN